MRKEEICFKSFNGESKLYAVKWLPDDGNYRAVVQISHGMVEYIERYEEFAKFLTDRGFLVVGHDHAGHGKSAEKEEDFGYFGNYGNNPSDVLVRDMHKLRTKIQNENQGIPYFMLAHSMGSYMLRKYITIYGDNLDGAIIVGTGFIAQPAVIFIKMLTKILAVFKGWRYRSSFIQQLTYTKPYRKYDLTGKDIERNWLTKDLEIVKKYYAKKECRFTFTLNAYMGLFCAVGYDAKIKNAKKIPKDLPLLMISGEEDPVGDLGKGVKKAYKMYKAVGIKDITCKLYPGDRHEIINETDRYIVFEDVYKWLRLHLK